MNPTFIQRDRAQSAGAYRPWLPFNLLSMPEKA